MDTGEDAMSKYRIINKVGGVDLGVFEAEDAYAAYTAMCKDAGYRQPSEVPGLEELGEGEIPKDILIVREG